MGRFGRLSVFHYDLYAQALAKIERSHAQDLHDVRHMFEEGLIEPGTLMELFDGIEDELFRYPAIDPTKILLQQLDRLTEEEMRDLVRRALK